MHSKSFLLKGNKKANLTARNIAGNSRRLSSRIYWHISEKIRLKHGQKMLLSGTKQQRKIEKLAVAVTILFGQKGALV